MITHHTIIPPYTATTPGWASAQLEAGLALANAVAELVRHEGLGGVVRQLEVVGAGHGRR